MKLSIAVGAKAAADCGALIDALMDQGLGRREGVELQIACNHRGAIADGPNTLISCTSEQSIFQLWRHAALNSTGDYVVYLPAKAIPANNWLDQAELALAHRGVHYGAIDPLSKQHFELGYLIEYSQFHSDRQRPPEELPGINLFLPREPLLASLDTAGFFKSKALARCAALGLANIWHPDLRVHYDMRTARGGYWRRRFRHGRVFGARRHELPAQPSKALCILGSFGLPLLRFWRLLRRTHESRHLATAVRKSALPILWAEVGWSLGELCGYLIGPSAATDADI
ncbi:MAG: hypothetical protein AAF384_08815 [Pseudomonadota bacterium]